VSIGQIVALVNYLLTTLGPLMVMANLTNVWAAAIARAVLADPAILILDEATSSVDTRTASIWPSSRGRRFRSHPAPSFYRY